MFGNTDVSYESIPRALEPGQAITLKGEVSARFSGAHLYLTKPDGTVDRIGRGIYVVDYPGVTLDQVTLRHSTDAPGSKTITLIARLNAFDGPLVGTATVTRDVGTTLTPTVFDFADAPVPAGSTITFEQVLSAGTGELSFDVGFGDCDGVFETFTTSPPLDVNRRDSVAITIVGRVASDAPVVVVGVPPVGLVGVGLEQVSEVAERTLAVDRHLESLAEARVADRGGEPLQVPSGVAFGPDLDPSSPVCALRHVFEAGISGVLEHLAGPDRSRVEVQEPRARAGRVIAQAIYWGTRPGERIGQMGARRRERRRDKAWARLAQRAGTGQ